MRHRYLSGRSAGISQEVLEAAWVDGSSKLQTFWRITVPLLSPVILFQVVTGVIGSLQAYVQATALTPGSISGGGGGGVSSGVPPEQHAVHGLRLPAVQLRFLFGYGCALLESPSSSSWLHDRDLPAEQHLGVLRDRAGWE